MISQWISLRMDDEADHGPDRDRRDDDEEALPQLVEMLDERRLLAMIEATRKPDPRHPQHLPLGRLGDGLGLLLRLGGRSRCYRLDGRSSGSGCRRGRLRRRELRMGVDLRRLLHPGDGVLELPHADAERAADLRQPLRPEEQQGKNEKKDQVSRLKKSSSHAIDRTTPLPATRNADCRAFSCELSGPPAHAGARSGLR